MRGNPYPLMELAGRINPNRETPLRAVARVSCGTAIPVFGSENLHRFELTEEAADLTWANSGRAPLLAEHSRSLQDVLGHLTRAWISAGVLYAEISFTREAERFANLINEGHVTSCSGGFTVMDAERDGEAVIVKRWSLEEVSLVAIPRDRQARLMTRADSEAIVAMADRDEAARKTAAAVRAFDALRPQAWLKWVDAAAPAIAAAVGSDPAKLQAELATFVNAHLQVLAQETFAGVAK